MSYKSKSKTIMSAVYPFKICTYLNHNNARHFS
nr:MAG TPA: hypothetical protein [Caudoviricetes sp.]